MVEVIPLGTTLHDLHRPPPSSPTSFRLSPMADDVPALPTSRLARWIAIGAVIVFAVALYFRDGRRLPPLTSPAAPAAAAEPAP